MTDEMTDEQIAAARLRLVDEFLEHFYKRQFPLLEPYLARDAEASYRMLTLPWNDPRTRWQRFCDWWTEETLITRRRYLFLVAEMVGFAVFEVVRLAL